MNQIFQHSSEAMPELPDESVHLVVTSPPYNVGMEYEEVLPEEEYRSILRKVWNECHRVLCHGGRACINIGGTGRNPYLPIQTWITQDMIDIGFLMRGDVIWHKGISRKGCAWGSWQSATNPVLRDDHEYILMFSKGSFDRRPTDGRKSTISKEEFMAGTRSIWQFNAENYLKTAHPCPYPVQLPYRCINLYSFQGDIVLDPFMGSGTTLVAAKMLGRDGIGYDTSEKYVDEAVVRLDAMMDLPLAPSE